MASVSPLAPGPVRIVLVDDHEMVIEGLKAMLAPFSGRVEVVGEAVGAEKAMAVIAELKPASPSRGVIRDPFDAPALAKALDLAGAAAFSVLTEGEFFGGSLKNLRDARKEVTQPVLRKPWRFFRAKRTGLAPGSGMPIC